MNEQVKSTEVAIRPPARQVLVSDDVVPILDTARFEHMQRIAQAMATGLLIPESLWKEKEEALPKEVITARCFMIVNQAVRWGLDPFAVAQCCSIIRGKLCYEGKLVQGVIEAKAGVIFDFAYSGDPMKPAEYGIKITGKFPDGRVREVSGIVEDWHTGAKGPWANPKNWPRMLHYRGSREWGRFFTPALLLGIYTGEEMDELAEDARSRREALPVQQVGSGIAGRLTAPKSDAAGFGANVAEAMNGNDKRDTEGAGDKAESKGEPAPQTNGNGAQDTAVAVQAEKTAGVVAGGELQGEGAGTDAPAVDVSTEAGRQLLAKLTEAFDSAATKIEVEATWDAFLEDIRHSSVKDEARTMYQAKLKAVDKPAKKKTKA